MNLLFKDQIHKLGEEEMPKLEFPLPLVCEVSIRQRSRSLRLTDLHWKRGLYHACTTDGIIVQNFYTTRTQERSSGARNIRSPRNLTTSELTILPENEAIFCAQINRIPHLVTPSNDMDNQTLADSVMNPAITLNHDAVITNESSFPTSLKLSPEVNDHADFVMPVPTSNVRHNTGHRAEFSWDTHRVYIYPDELCTRYYTAKTVSGAVAKFARHASVNLGLPFTDLYPLVKQWFLETKHPILQAEIGSEFNLYMIPKVFYREHVNMLKRIILQRFDVLEVKFERA